MGLRDFGLVIDQVQAASIDAQGIDVSDVGGISVQTEFGNVTGTLTLQGRNHKDLVWQTIDEVAFTQPAGAAGGELFDIGNLRCRYVRIAYAHTSGTGSLKVAVFGKTGGL